MAKKCDNHRRQHRSVNITLWGLLLLALCVMFWHVWVYGPLHGQKELLAQKAFPLVMVDEITHLLLGSHGLAGEIGDVWVYFMIGILITGYIRTFKLHIRLRKTLARHGFMSIFIASIIGVFSPLCSCGILATVIGLLSAGLPLAPAMALLISSPLMSPTAFLLTIGDLGAEWAAIRTVAAFMMGVLAGSVTHLLSRYGFKTEKLFLDSSVVEGDFHDHDNVDERLRCTCREKYSNRLARRVKSKFIIFWAKTLEMTWMIGKYVLVGIAVGAVAEEYIPPTWLNELFGHQSRYGIIWVTLGSIPVFLHQISASSILFHIKEVLPGTLDKGSALAFLIGGPVTAIPAMTLLWAMFKKRVFVLYMGISILGTILLAYSFNAFIFVPHTDVSNPVLSGVGTIYGGASSVMEKSNQYVHIAADPKGKPIIATYHDLEGGSGIVFDASLERFSSKSIDVEDNAIYIKNIANWLEENSFTGAAKSILVYNSYAKQGYKTEEFREYLQKILNDTEYKVSITDRAETPLFTAKLLKKYNQLWLFSGEAKSSSFSKDEIESMLDFRDNGGGLLIVSGPKTDKSDFTSDANQLANNFGINYSGTLDTPEIIHISITGKFFNVLSNKFKGYYNVIRKVRE